MVSDQRPIGDKGSAVKLGCHAYSNTAIMWPRDNTTPEIENTATNLQCSPRSRNVLATSCTALYARIELISGGGR
jgi:hypothetical protein